LATEKELSARVFRFEDGKLQEFSGDKKNYSNRNPDYCKSGHLLELEYFIDCLRKNKKPALCPPEESRDSVALALAVAESIAKNQEIQFPKQY
jgi:predicted dehydrogenase